MRGNTVNYTALSPWGEVDSSDPRPLSPRPETLNGKTIGMFSHFKQHSPVMLRELAKLLAEKLPGTKFTHLQYAKDTNEVVNDPEFDPVLKEWLKGVDVVIAAYGDAGSCAMFHAYNTAYVERLGTPAVMLVKTDLLRPAQRGASARLVPNLRFVSCDMADLSMLPALGEADLDLHMRPFLPQVVDGLIDAMTRPLRPEEKDPPRRSVDYARITVTGSLEDISNAFYKYGWTNGAPIIPPTEEAVAEMLRGTDLPRDYVVGVIPPLLGKATVEKIAINGVMAGCLPTYMPVLIAAVRGMLDPCIHLEGWTCSVSSWAPFMTVTGPASRAIHLNAKGALMSPYHKPSATISRAVAHIIMNIGGVRPVLEDMSQFGHQSRFGVCITEDEEGSPWQPLHMDYGFNQDDSAITMFWPHEQRTMMAGTTDRLLADLCAMDVGGFDPGAMLVVSPRAAQSLATAGWSKQKILNYVLEYSRHPGSQVMLRWLIGNHHVPGVDLPGDPNFVLPAFPEHSTRRFWSKEHLFMVVGGSDYGYGIVAFTGGGDHGGPSCTKIELPGNWEALVKEYDDLLPGYVNY